MSQSSISNMQAPNPMKRKVIAAVLAVVVGHVGALWALSHLKTPELKPIEKKPIQVKFVKIKEEFVPPPPVKPKVEPKPVVEKKVIPPKPVERPKVIAQKKPVVEKKVIQQPEEKVDYEKIKREQEQRQQEQQRLEQQRLDEQRRLQEQQRLEQQRQQEQQRQEQARRDQEAKQPRKLSAGEISWKTRPSFEFEDDLLKNQNRSLTVRIEISPSGKITNVTVINSSGLPSLDREVRSAVRSARMNPSNDGRAMVADLPVSLKTSGQ